MYVVTKYGTMRRTFLEFCQTGSGLVDRIDTRVPSWLLGRVTGHDRRLIPLR